MKKSIPVLVLVIIVLATSVVYAHKPIYTNEDAITVEKAQKIENADISWAIYGELTGKNDVYFYKVDGKKDMDLYLQMTIPKIKGNEDFKPTIALLGKEFKGATEEVSFEVPAGYGVKLIEPTEVQENFFEPFTQTNYLIRQEDTIKLKNDDTYYIAVFSKDNKTGKYTLAVGKKEDFGFKDILMFPYTWLRVRLWYNAPQTLLIVGGIVLVVWGVVKVIKKVVRR